MARHAYEATVTMMSESFCRAWTKSMSSLALASNGTDEPVEIRG